MDLNEMTKKDFRNLKLREYGENIGAFDSLVIIPREKKALHDSGYRNMYFVACKNGEPVCKMSGCSDVLHLDGISGNILKPNIRSVWKIDALAGSGYLRLFNTEGRLKAGVDLSDFDILRELQEEK